MAKSYIKVNSITHAIKAKDVLNSKGIRAQIMRKTKTDKNESCGYAVVVDGDVVKAVEILKQNHVKFSGYADVRERL